VKQFEWLIISLLLESEAIWVINNIASSGTQSSMTLPIVALTRWSTQSLVPSNQILCIRNIFPFSSHGTTMKMEAVLSFVMVMGIYRNRRTIVPTLTGRTDNFTFQMLINFESTPFNPNEGWCRQRRLTKGAHGCMVTIRRKVPLPTSQSIP